MRTTRRVFVALVAAFLTGSSVADNQPPSEALAQKIAACDKLPDPIPTDNSATGRGVAAARGMGVTADCRKKAEAETAKASASASTAAPVPRESKTATTEAEWRAGIQKGSAAPLKEYKY